MPLALFKGFVIDQIWALLDEHFEDILDFLVLVTNVMGVTSDDRLVVTNKFTLALSLVTTSLAVHD